MLSRKCLEIKLCTGCSRYLLRRCSADYILICTWARGWDCSPSWAKQSLNLCSTQQPKSLIYYIRRDEVHEIQVIFY